MHLLLESKELNSSKWLKTKDLKLIFKKGKVDSIFEKFNSIENKLDNVSNSARGILPNKEDVSKNKIDDTYETYFTGKLDRYVINKAFNFVKYGDNLKEKPKNQQFFSGERILVRRIINRRFRIMANFVDYDFVVKKDIYIVKLNTSLLSPKYILSLLNSTLYSFIKTGSSTAAIKDDFTQLTLSDIRNFPIPKLTLEEQKLYISLVEQILSIKQADAAADTSALEAEIDVLVYRLYKLTYDEVLLVESGFSMPREAYEA